VGIGVNCAVSADQFPANLRQTAASLHEFSSDAIDRSLLARRLIQRLDQRYHDACAKGTEIISGAWRERADLIGDVVNVHVQDECIQGTLRDVDPTGDVLLELAAGGKRTIAARRVRSIEVNGDGCALKSGRNGK
jgi:BirA family biotin operon repressor/biotin-[acetyl-CoA-carboxylase] ligase